MALTVNIPFGFALNQTGVGTAAIGSLIAQINESFAMDFTSGTGASQVNCAFVGLRSLALGANETLDLYASGALLDPLEKALTMTALKFLFIRNLSTTQNLIVGGGTTPVGLFSDASDLLPIKPLGTLIWCDPSAAGLVLTTNKNLKVEFGGTGATHTYKIVALGLD